MRDIDGSLAIGSGGRWTFKTKLARFLQSLLEHARLANGGQPFEEGKT